MRKTIGTILTITLLVALTSVAYAAPRDFTKTCKRDGITYAVSPKLKAAVVKRMPNRKRVTIPAEVRVGGKWYEVRAVWDSAIPKRVRTITIHADLETIEDGRAWHVNLRVTRKGMYKWLKGTGAHVTRTHCTHCE